MVQRINIKERKAVQIYFVGDMHVGAKTFDRKSFEKTIEMIKQNKNARVIFMGDYGDYIESDDTRRYDPANIDPSINTAIKQTKYVYEKLKPIRNKIYGLLRGNHESAYAKYHSELFDLDNRDYAELIANKLKVDYLEDMGVISIQIGKQNYKIVVAHGCGASAQLSGQIRSLNKIINSFEITPDIAAMGHVHALQTIVNPKMNFKFNTKIKHLGLTGNYYKTYIQGNINYASSNLYNPLPIGCIMYELDKKGNIQDNKIIFD